MTSSKRWQQVESLFHAALMRKGRARQRLLSEAGSSDPTLRREVESLLAAHERTGLTDIFAQELFDESVGGDDLRLTPGELINHYRLVGLIGKGGMGVVYKAEDTRLMRTVAIKAFPKQAGSAWGEESIYLREARAGSAISHPNIVTIHEISETAEIVYIVMEYLEAQSLGELIGSGSLGFEQVLSIAIQVCDALAAVHSRQIIHRDIKPANVMVTAQGQVKLLDFGIAKTFHTQQSVAPDAQPQAGSGEVVGTICYMSPEQIRAEPLDERTDIFSFGVLLYEMMTGEMPFHGARAMDVVRSILNEAPREIRPAPEGVPQQARDLVMQCLEKDREKRPPSFTEIRNRLKEQARQIEETTRSQERSHAAGLSGFNYKPMAPTLPIILVLPIEVMGADDDEESLGLGLSYMISTNLARIRGLSVISKAAVERQAERPAGNARELAHELGATLLLEGEMLSLDDGYAVMARLSEAGKGRIIWGRQYFGDSSDLFRIHQALCRDVALALNVDMSTADRQQIARPSTDDIEALEFYSRARALLDRYDVKENIDEAIRLLEAAVKDHPEFALPFTGLSEAYWHKYLLTVDDSWVKRAIAACDRALVLDPYQPEVHISLANIYYNTGRIEQSMESFGRAIDIQPASDRALRGLAWCYQKKGDVESAVSCFEKAIAARPGCWYYYNDLGKCYYASGSYEKAAEQFRRVIAVQPDTYNGYNNLGVVYCLLGHYEDAIAMHKRAIAIHPSEEAYSNLGTEYFYLGRYEEAAEEYRRAIDMFPAHDMFYFNLGEAYLQLGRRQEAIHQFERARDLVADHLKVIKDNGPLYGRMASYLAKLGRHDDALDYITRALSLEPGNPLLIFQRAVVHALAGRTEDAAESLRAALALGYSKTDAMHDPNLKSVWSSEALRSTL